MWLEAIAPHTQDVRRITTTLLLAVVIALPATGATILIDFDTPGTGLNLAASPLVTAAGIITATNLEVTGTRADPDQVAVGASGNVGDIFPGLATMLSFDFTVASVTFIYGGNAGDILVEALDGGNNVVASFFQASTDDGEPAGPTTLTAANIRAIRWSDSLGGYAPLDNLVIETTAVPEPSTWVWGALAIGLLSRRKSRIKSMPGGQ